MNPVAPPLLTPEQLVADLVLLLDLEPAGGDRFIGRQKPDGTGRVFGGQAIAQAFGAARRTVAADRHAHSLHAYFLRAGSDDLPIDLKVERDFDGGSFSNRRVIASQRGQPILNLAASFQRTQSGFSHQADAMPRVPPPEDLKPDSEVAREVAEQLAPGPVRQLLLRPQPVDLRPVATPPWLEQEPRAPLAQAWFRTVASLPDDMAVHRAVLAYISDFQVLATAMLPHGLSLARGNIRSASLDHALWFHDDFRVDDWLLYTTDAPWSGGARGFGRGQIFTRDGRLVASVAQEGMLRPVS